MAGDTGRNALVLVGSSENDVDLLYATAFLVPDPIVYVQVGRWRAAMVSALEYGRAMATAGKQGIHIFTPQSVGLEGNARRDLAKWVEALLAIKGIRNIRVPASFPSGILRKLEAARISVDVMDQDPFAARRIKSTTEIRMIRQAQQAAVIAMRSAIGLLAESQIDREGLLRAGNRVLTAEGLQRRIAEVLLRHDCYCGQTIVACGQQGANPHEQGCGPLFANQPIVIDIFPRHQKHGYCGDITRTVLKGKASRALKHMYQTVKRAHGAALRVVRAGVPARTVHQAAVDAIASRGYPTGRDESGFYGFIHSTGHGVGLAVHEAPSIGSSSVRLKAGDVITIEPGLYYREVGGMRVEDTVVVTETGYKYLVPCEKVFEIP